MSFITENFLDQGKIMACGKVPSKRKNPGLWKSFLIVKKCLFVERIKDKS